MAAAVVVPNNPPAFSADTAARSVAENTAAGQNVGAALTATDADSDTLTYTLEGTDAASFDIVSGSGQIRTRTGVTYNHEAKSTHTVVVKADDGNGGTDTVTVTITVTDVDEPPGQPAAPSVSATAGSTTSLDVTWTAPTNTGPAIASYDLQYRAGTSGNFTNGPQNVTGTSAAIGSLAADTSYEVQVRATNAEGDGDWSVAGTGRTTATSAPGAPTGLTATASGTTAINLSWSAPASTGGSAITGYKIEVVLRWRLVVVRPRRQHEQYHHHLRAHRADRRHHAPLPRPPSTQRHRLQRRQPPTRHRQPTARLRTPGDTGGPPSPADHRSNRPPGAPPRAPATRSRSPPMAAPADLVANTNTTTTYAHTGLTAGTTRHYRVSAINANGTGVPPPTSPTPPRDPASRPPPPGAPRRAPAAPPSPATRSNRGPPSLVDLVANSNTTTTYAHTGLGDTATRVSAINANGDPTTGTRPRPAGPPRSTSPGAPRRAPAAPPSPATRSNRPPMAARRGPTSSPTRAIPPPPTRTGLTAGTTRHAINTNGTGTASTRHRHHGLTAGTTAAPAPPPTSTAPPPAPVPGAPTGLTATASGTTAIDLSWSAPASTGGSAITGYKIESSSDGGSSWSDLVANTSNTTTTYAHTGLTAGTTRHYRVSAINANGTGTASNVDSATTGTTVPGAPTGLTATASGTTAIDLSWSAPASTGGSAITGYKIESSSDGGSSWSDLVANTSNTTTTYAHTGLTAGTTRHYRVSAINANGAGTASNVDSATTGTTVPGAPTGLTATASGTTAINLSWSAPASTGGSAITGYKIEVSPNGTSGWTDQVANTNSTATTYAHTGLPPAPPATTASPPSTPTAPAPPPTSTAPPPAPPCPALRPASRPRPAGPPRSTSPGAPRPAPAAPPSPATRSRSRPTAPPAGPTRSPTPSNTTTTYAHTGLTAGTTRHYRVSAINANGTGTASNVDSATTGTTAPGAPTGLTATASGTTAINLSWTAPASTGGSAITGYKIEVSPNGTSGWTDQVANTKQYHHHLRAHRADRRHHAPLPRLRHQRQRRRHRLQRRQRHHRHHRARRSDRAHGHGQRDHRDHLSWSAPASTGGSAITGYRIEVSSNRLQLDQPRRQHEQYHHHLRPHRADRRHHAPLPRLRHQRQRRGTASNVASATTGTTAPGAPTGLTATASGTTAINLSWSAPGSTGGSAITGYRIEVSSNGTSSWTNLVANTSNTTTTYAHTGLTAGTTRHYRVSAINTNGTGTASTVANATTGQTTVTFGASSYTAAEGGATATVAVQLSAAASATVTIPLTKTHRGGATAADYSGVPSNVTFTAGQTRRTFTVTATDDADKDGGESVQLGFGTLPAGYAPGARRTATVTLVDDDANLIVNFGTERHTTVKVRESDTVWHRFTFSLSTSRDGPPNGNPQQPVTIPLVVTHRGGATPADYEVRGRRTLTSVTFGVGESVTDFFMRAIPDGKREPGEGLRLDFGPLPPGVRKGTWGPHETIEFVDQVLPGYTVLFGADAYTATEGGADAQVSIHLNEPVEIEPLDVRLLLEYGGGATDADHGRIDPVVTIPVGKQTATITVTATDDTDDDDGERVVLSFVNDPNDRVRVRTGSASATVTLEDNDGPERVTVSFGAATYTATEGGSDATVRVALDVAPGRAVTVPLTITDIGGATAEDYSGIPADVTFGADQTAMTFAVTATANDGISDGGESLSIGFGTLPEGVVAGSPTATTVTLADGTEQRLVVNFGSSLGHTVQAREGARRLRLNVLLDSSPRRPVTIPLVVTHVGGATEADYAAIPEIVTFAAGQTSAHYYARALPDEEDETGEGLRLDFGELPPGVRKGTWGPYETIDFVDAGQAANLSVAGPVLTVGYPGALDRGSTPSPRDFVVLTAVPGGEAVIPVTAVAVDGDVVSLALARPVRPDDTVTLSYLADAMHPTRDAAGLPAAPLTDEPVRNVTGASDPQAKTRLPAAAPGGVGTGRLDLSSRNLTDVTALAGLTSLRELDLRHNAVTDLWPLAGLTGLQALYLSGNQIADLRPLAGLTGLQVLDLSGNQITDLWPLAELPGLRELDLRDNAVADLRPLESLRGLQALDLSGNQIADLWSLTYLAALERLNLVDNAVADLWPLAERPGLQVLLLDRNRITTVQALSSLAGLANLGLAENRIADLWPLAGLGRLHRLDLAGNAVADVSALGDVSGLVWLRLLGNPVSHALPLGRLAQLRWLWLDAGPAPPR